MKHMHKLTGSTGLLRGIDMKKLIIYVFAVSWAVMALYPLFFTLISSLKTTDEIYQNPFGLPEFFRIVNYERSFGSDHHMGIAIMNSFIFASGGVMLMLVVSSMAAFVLSRFNLKIVTPVFIFFTMGIMIPIHTTLIPLVRMINTLGISNQYWSLIMLYAAFNIPLAVLITTGYMKGIPKEMVESAIIDGCSPRVILGRIIVPLSLPALSTAAILCFQAIYNDLIFALLFINRQSMYPISLALLRFQGSWHIELGPVFAAIIVAIMPVVIIYTFFQDKIQHGLSAGAVKG